MQACKTPRVFWREKNQVLVSFFVEIHMEMALKLETRWGRWRKKVKLKYDKCNKIFEQEHFTNVIIAGVEIEKRNGGNEFQGGKCQVRACTFSTTAKNNSFLF